MTRLIVTTATVLALLATGTCYGGWPFHGRHHGRVGGHQQVQWIPTQQGGGFFTGARFDRVLDFGDRVLGTVDDFTPSSIVDGLISDGSESGILIERSSPRVVYEFRRFEDFIGAGGSNGSDDSLQSDGSESGQPSAPPQGAAPNEDAMEGLRTEFANLDAKHQELMDAIGQYHEATNQKIQAIETKVDALAARVDARFQAIDGKLDILISRGAGAEENSTTDVQDASEAGAESSGASDVPATEVLPRTETAPVPPEPAPTSNP